MNSGFFVPADNHYTEPILINHRYIPQKLQYIYVYTIIVVGVQ